MAKNTNILSKLKELSNQNKFKVFSRTLNTDIDTLPLTIKQSKEVIKTALDNILSPLTLPIATSDIIKSNTQEFSKLSIIDKPLLLLALRANSIGTKYKTKIDDKEVEIDFTNNLAQRDVVDLSTLTQQIQFNDAVITTRVPTLIADYNVNKECIAYIQNNKGKDEDKLKNLVGEVYIHEIIKFISTITFKGVDDKIEFNTEYSDDLAIKQQLEVIEVLPLSILQDLVKFISNVRDIENKPLKVVVEGTEQTITLDTAFFTRE